MGKKKCIWCKEKKEESEFPFRNRKNLTTHSHCKERQKEYSKKHYSKNREKHNRRRYENQKRYREERRERIFEYLSNHPCVDCGERDPCVLEFDHVKEKEKEVSIMAADCKAWGSILKEIEKCEIRCANCHRRKTARENGWYKYRKSEE